MKSRNKITSFLSALFVNFHHWSFTKKVGIIVQRMGNTEKIIFFMLSVIILVTGLTLVFRINNSFMVEVPVLGGSFTEGLVGSPRFINPVLAISDTDKDLSSLIYSGLMKISKEGGLEPDLAKSYEVNTEGTVYEFTLRDHLYFHDSKPVTVDDIIFTIEKVSDPVIKSPKQANWSGVSVEKISDKKVRFNLEKSYSPFLSVLTLGILPKHAWKEVTPEEFPFSQLNINPIGSGPYQIEKISRNSGGTPTSITLSSWKKYFPSRPKIKSITFKFFQNEEGLEEAFEEESIDNMVGFSPNIAKNIASEDLVNGVSLPRVFGIFFNQNVAPVFLNKEVREALKMATPKKKIVDEVLIGFGRVLDGPTPVDIDTSNLSQEGEIESARALLLEDGWEENEDGILEKETKEETSLLRFSISTSDAPELKRTAEILKETWEKMGAFVEVKIFEAGDLSQNVIKPRKYDALLFGEIVSEESDLYPFWHSSGRNDPGLNISLYANITVDGALEEIREETDRSEIAIKKEVVISEIKDDIPAIFLFSPDLLYAKSSKIKNVTLKNVSSLNERFSFIDKWFIETDKVWKFFK